MRHMKIDGVASTFMRSHDLLKLKPIIKQHFKEIIDMFGSKELVANLLKQHVGKYINVDPDNVAVSLWSGKVELENLALNTDALQTLH